MKLSSVFSYADVMEMKNEGLNDNEIIQKAKEKIAYQKSPEYGAEVKANELENFKRKELEKNFANYAITAQDQANLMSGRNRADEIASKYRKNIQDYEEKQIVKERAEATANSKQKQIANAIETMGGLPGEAAAGVAKAATFIPHTIAKFLAKNTDSKVAKSFYEKSKSARANLDKAQELYNARTGQDGAAVYKGFEIGTEILADPLTYYMPWAKSAKFAARGAGYALTGGAEGALHEYGSNEKATPSDIAKMGGIGAGLGLAGGALIEGAIKGGGALYNKFKNRGANSAETNTAPNTAPSTQNSSLNTQNSSSQTAQNSSLNTQNISTEDLATNGVWLDYGNTAPKNGGLLRGDNFVTDPNSANVEQNIVANFELAPNVRDLTKISTDEISADLSHLSEKHPEMFEKASDVFKLIKEIKDEPQFFYRNNRLDGALIAKRLQEQGKIGKVVVNKENGEVIHATKTREQDLARLERVANKNDERVRALSTVSSRKVEQGGGLPNETMPQHPLKTADDIIDLVPDENGVYQVAFNGSSKELAKIATEIAKGEPVSLGAKRLMYIADNLANAASKDAEQKIGANIAKIDNDSVELYANNTALLGDIAKKYPMLNKDEQIELANKQILANASAELIEYSKFLNGGSLPKDARLLGKNLGRMILKSLNAGASKQEIIDMLLKAGISGRNSTAAKNLLQTGDINAYNAVMRQGEAELIAELSQNVRTIAKKESVGAILNGAKAKAIENDKLLKQGVGNQGLDDVITTFKSSKSGKEFEVAENGFGRELLSYDGQVANEEIKRAFTAWEMQDKKADITLNDGRKVVFLEPDEAMQLSYGNSYLYGEKDFEALFARKQAESLEQKLERLQSHPAYENLLKKRENVKASELKGETFDGAKPIVYYDHQSDRYLRTKGGYGLPNAERSITITKADVAKLRAGKANEALAIKLENNLDALTNDPYASGVLDDLLTRDYHLASAAKKSELVAPKNADEVAKSAENTQRNSKILTNQDIKEQISKWDLSAPKQTLITNKIDGEELEKLNEHFKFKGNYPLTRQIDSEHIKHALSHHGDEKIEALRGQKAITLDDIANYENYAKTADIKEYIDKKVISKKQINGHFVVVEEALTGKNRLNFVSMWYVKGKIKDVAPVSTPKNDLDRTLSNRYDSANSSKDEIKSQGVGGKLEPLKTDESKNFKVFDGLVGFFEDNLSKRKNAYADFADDKRRNFEIYEEKRKILIDTPREQWSKEQREFFDGLEDYQQEGILDLKHDNEVLGKIPYGKLSYRNQMKVMDDAIEKSAKYKELVTELKKLEMAKRTAGEGGKYPHGAQLAKITRAQNKIAAQRDELINTFIKEYNEKVAGNSKIPADEVSVELKNDPFSKLRAKTYKFLKSIQGKTLTNKQSKIKAHVNSDGAKKMVSDAAIEKSKNNGYSAREHLSAANKIDELFENANFVNEIADKNGHDSIKRLNFEAPVIVEGNKAVALITAKKSVDKYSNTIYSLELQEIKQADIRGGKAQTAQKQVINEKMTHALPETSADKQAFMSENSTQKKLLSQESAMRENFSAELKASYELRDKLLNSAGNEKARLKEAGKAELEKLLKSKDSKLSRDAQIIKTLENAKSDPKRHARLKKLYLDENGKVKDSIGLC